MESKSTSYEVCGERIVVLPDPLATEHNGLVLPETRAAQPVTGTITQVGLGVGFFQSGMRVAYAERAGILTRIDDEAVRILDPSEILGILHDDQAV